MSSEKLTSSNVASSADPVRIPKLLLSDLGSVNEINARNSIQFVETEGKEDVIINSYLDTKEAESDKLIEVIQFNKGKSIGTEGTIISKNH